jgi:ABC-type antimicrobial peptide transport system permease subunit
LTLIGVVVGVSMALVLTRLMNSLLFGVSPTDIGVTGAGVLLSTFVALVACLIPARRAASIDPLRAITRD